MSTRKLLELERAGKLLYGSPLAPENLDQVEMPDDRIVKAVRPAVPILCATRALDTAVRRKGNRLRAWVYDLGTPTPLQQARQRRE